MSDETADKKSETSDTDKKSVPERVFKEYNLKRIQAESVKITAERAIEIIPKLAENKTRIIPFNIAKIFSFNAPLLQNDAVRHCTIEAFKNFPGAASHVAGLLSIEGEYLNLAALYSRESFVQTHEDDYIAALQDIGGKEAVQELATTIARWCPEKAIAALETMDDENAPEAIFLSGKVDFEAGLGQHNADALGAMALLHKRAKAGEFRSISTDSVQNFTRALVKSLLDAPSLLKALEGCRPYPSKGSYSSFDIDDREDIPVPDELIASFKAALKAVDDQGMLSRKVSRVFSDVVKHHKRTQKSEKSLQSRIAKLEL